MQKYGEYQSLDYKIPAEVFFQIDLIDNGYSIANFGWFELFAA